MGIGWLISLFSLVEVLGIALLLHFVPQWSRPEHFFAYTVPVTFRGSSHAREVLSSYRRRLWTGAAIAVAFSLTPLLVESVLPVLLAPVVLLAFAAWAYFAARREVRPAAVPPAALAREDPPALAVPFPLAGGWLGQLGPFLVLAAMAVWLAGRWEGIPARFVSHWNGRFEPDGWMEKSWGTVGLPLLMGAALCGMMLLLAWGLSRGSWRAHRGPRGGAGALGRLRSLGSLLLGLSYLLAIVFAAIAATPLVQTAAGAKLFVVLLAAGSVLGPMLLLVVWFVRHGKEFAASYRKGEAQDRPGEPPLGDRLEDRFWKAGLFYYNPGDPAVFVEQRFGIGFTTNFARAGAWWFLAAVILLPLSLVLLVLAFA